MASIPQCWVKQGELIVRLGDCVLVQYDGKSYPGEAKVHASHPFLSRPQTPKNTLNIYSTNVHISGLIIYAVSKLVNISRHICHIFLRVSLGNLLYLSIFNCVYFFPITPESFSTQSTIYFKESEPAPAVIFKIGSL